MLPLLLLLLVGPAPKPKAVANVKTTNVAVRPAMAADTLVSTVTWTNPTSDGKGPLDSLKVNITNFAGGWWSIKYTGTTWPTTWAVRQAIPFQDATFTVYAQLCTYRGTSANAANCLTVAAPPFVYVLAAPPPVTGASVANVKVP